MEATLDPIGFLKVRVLGVIAVKPLVVVESKADSKLLKALRLPKRE